jgi:hypothetical protein
MGMSNHPESDQEETRLREQLQRAVKSEAIPPYLEAKIRNRIRASEARPIWGRRWLAPVTAVLAVAIGGGIAYELGHLRLTVNSQESYITSVSNRVATIMRVGLGDHIHCTVFRKFPKSPEGIAALTGKLEGEYKGLAAIVKAHAPKDSELVTAHHCRYRGRRFAHLAVRDGSNLMSLVVARKNEGESFETEGLMPALIESGIPVYRAGVQRFEIASFESPDHLVYFVSDLDQQKNTEMLVAMAPEIRHMLERL